MYVEPLRLKGREPVGYGQELRAHRSEAIESFFQAEVCQVVGADFISQESGELLILFEERISAVSAEDVQAPEELIAFDDALAGLDAEVPRKANIIELCYLGGMTVEKVARSLRHRRTRNPLRPAMAMPEHEEQPGWMTSPLWQPREA